MARHEVSLRRRNILEAKQWTDCKFKVGQGPEQEIIEAHKLMLAMSSPVFGAMFYGETEENREPIEITNIQPETFKAFLDYVYTENIKLESFELACELCYCADKYDLPFLYKECTKFITENLSVEKVFRAYEVTRLLAQPEQMKKCLEIIRTQTDEVLRHNSFEEIKLDTLLMILEQDTLRIGSEVELFYATERWAKAECVRKGLNTEDERSMRSVLGTALTKIRFLTLTLEELAEISTNSSLLDRTAIVAIFGNIHLGRLKHPMPEGFSTNTRKRGLQITGIPKPIQRIFVGDNEIGEGRENYRNQVIFSRKFAQESLPPSSYIFEESLSVDKKIWLIGVQVPSQIRHDVPRYTESLKVELRNDSVNSDVTATTNFTGDVEPGTLIKVTFQQPQLIEANREYILRIIFGKESWATCPCHVRQSFSEPVSFKFEDDCPFLRNRKLISSIIYTPRLSQNYCYH